MARVLYTWELGWQLSHLANIDMLARGLADEGHEIGVAARELHEAKRFFPGIRVQYYQAPFHQGRSPELPAYLSYAHLLHASGYADPRELAILLSAWMGVLRSFQPDLLVCDHSPTALLASRALGLRCVLMGSGFLVPPRQPDEPLGVFPDTPRTARIAQILRNDEARVLDVLNEAAAPFGIPPLTRLGELYDDVPDRLLLTWAELDPFREARPDAGYAGIWSSGSADPPGWGPGARERIFAYLSPFPGCEGLLRALAKRDAEVRVYAPGLPGSLRRLFQSDEIRFHDDIVDLFALGPQCHLFVSHGAHTSVAATLSAGIPQLMIPLYREQELTARRVVSLGAGQLAEATTGAWQEGLQAVLDRPGPRAAARLFAARYADFDREAAASSAGALLEGCLPGRRDSSKSP